ncbi:hypothetical protein N657DRAFT_688421 [Parathielavia appendiculata]|uniref:Uncharacterized protein n=1 Tax=Parathielavia appendiculata TaxID=2587402 RepID=A0AAN6U3F2_9PEZI|nr:hypothetical protein N657DRAFT_688421 [Parathielavia appendiculata]
MTSKTTVGRKRTRSLAGSDSADTKLTAPKTAPPIRAILIHLSALLSSDAAITSTLRKALSGILPRRDIPDMADEAILRAFSTSSNFYTILRELNVRNLSDDERKDIESRYCVVYEMEGIRKLCLDPHANSFLEEAARQPYFRLATTSSNPMLAANLVEKLGIKSLEAVIPTSDLDSITDPSEARKTFHSKIWKRLIEPWFSDPIRRGGWDSSSCSELDDSSKDIASKLTTTTTATSNDDNPQAKITTITTSQTVDIPKPDLTANNPNNYRGPDPTAAPLQPSEVMVISCTLYDLNIAKAAGMQTCWVRKIRGEEDIFQQRAAGNHDIIVSNLDEARLKLFGSGDNEAGNPVVDDQGKGHAKGKAKAKKDGVMKSISKERHTDDDLVMQGIGEEQAKKQAAEVGMGGKNETTQDNDGEEKDTAVREVAEDKEVVQMEICDD